MARYAFVLLALVIAVPAALPAHAAPKGGGDDGMDFEPEEIQKSGPPSKTMERAGKLYKRLNYYSATIEFYKVLNGETEDSEANKQKAEFFMGKTLFQMKFYAGALAYFDAIVQKGGAHRYYVPTLKWLAALAKVLPESAGILERIGKYSREDLESPALEPVRAELYYLLGRHFYREGSFDQAIELFQMVPQKSEFYVKAKYFEGVTYVRQYKGAPALDALKRILTIATEPELRKLYKDADVREFEDRTNLAMAEVFYTTKQFDTSIKYFEKLGQESSDWVRSLFEASWAYFLKKSYSKALGNIHTLTAPYFENEFFPEAVVLKANIYYNYCRYDRALEAVEEYFTGFEQLRDDLQKVVKKNEDDDTAFYQFVQKIRRGNSGILERSQLLAQTALADKTLLKTFDYVTELDRELGQHEKADKAWKTTAIAGQVLQELTVQKSLAEAQAGRVARERLTRVIGELNELRRDARKVKIEVLNAQAGAVAAELQQDRVASKKKSEAIVIDDEHQTWSFNGEYWKDELGFYRFKIASQCSEQAK